MNIAELPYPGHLVAFDVPVLIYFITHALKYSSLYSSRLTSMITSWTGSLQCLCSSVVNIAPLIAFLQFLQNRRSWLDQSPYTLTGVSMLVIGLGFQSFPRGILISLSSILLGNACRWSWGRLVLVGRQRYRNLSFMIPFSLLLLLARDAPIGTTWQVKSEAPRLLRFGDRVSNLRNAIFS